MRRPNDALRKMKRLRDLLGQKLFEPAHDLVRRAMLADLPCGHVRDVGLAASDVIGDLLLGHACLQKPGHHVLNVGFHVCIHRASQLQYSCPYIFSQ